MMMMMMVMMMMMMMMMMIVKESVRITPLQILCQIILNS